MELEYRESLLVWFGEAVKWSIDLDLNAINVAVGEVGHNFLNRIFGDDGGLRQLVSSEHCIVLSVLELSLVVLFVVLNEPVFEDLQPYLVFVLRLSFFPVVNFLVLEVFNSLPFHSDFVHSCHVLIADHHRKVLH